MEKRLWEYIKKSRVVCAGCVCVCVHVRLNEAGGSLPRPYKSYVGSEVVSFEISVVSM